MQCKTCGTELGNNAKCPACGTEKEDEFDFGGVDFEEKTFTAQTQQDISLGKPRYCTHCGQRVHENAVVCVHCGCAIAFEHQNFEQPKKNGMAIAGFVCSFFMPLLGWIFGGIGLSKSKKLNGKGKGLSIAALVIASIGFIMNFMINLLLY